MDKEDVSKVINHVLGSYVNEDHRKEVEEYIKIRKRVDKVNKYTIRNDVFALYTLDKVLKNKPYNKATEKDIENWDKELQKEYKQSSIDNYSIHVKRFYKYLSDKKSYKKGKGHQKNILYPDCVSWISKSSNGEDENVLERVLTHEELLRMLNVCDNIRDQAMIVSFVDGGLRNGELIALNYESLQFDKLGAYFILPKREEGKELKTGGRKIRLFLVPSAKQYLKEYKNKHPFKNYDKAPLFYTRDPRNYPEVLRKVNNGTVKQEDFEKLRLAKKSINDIIKRIAKLSNAPITKTHDLRHVSATWCVKAGFSEPELRFRFGWKKSSKMPSRYVHLEAKDIDDKVKVITGFKEPEKDDRSLLQAKICLNCDYENQPTNIVCGQCGMKLDISKDEITATAVETGIAVQKQTDDPETLKEMIKLMANRLEKLEKQLQK
jgi:integrase